MEETAKYLVHAEFTADGVVERSDVVGAVYGQTEGLLGDDLDLRDLQQSSKVGRIDVAVESREGRSTGDITIASRLDKVETAILAAALETIERVGPCQATIEVDRIEDVRAAKRRRVVERAEELLETAFDEGAGSTELVEAVRERTRVERITEYEGLPAGPRVADSDAIIVVEGRADVLTLLKYGVKNAVAVEGTNVPDAVAALTRERTTTAFLDGDRGGDLILRELDQVGDIDYVAFAPEGRSVEDLDRSEVLAALREKVPAEAALAEIEAEAEGGEEARDDVTAATDGSTRPAPTPGDAPGVAADAAVPTLDDHVRAAIDAGTARLLDSDLELLAEVPIEDALEAVVEADPAPSTLVVGGELTQRLLDAAAQRGIDRAVARETGEFTKRPTSVRIRTAEDVTAADA